MTTKRTRIPRVNIEAVSEDAWRLLARLFETPMDSPVYEANPYALNKALGWRPWHPCACEIWQSETPPEPWMDNSGSWPALRAQLEQLHAEYLRRKAEA
jgi:hypothetical protein